MDFNVSEISAIGDGLNDLEMHGGVGLSLTVDNAESEVKALITGKGDMGYVASSRAGKGFLEAVKWAIDKDITKVFNSLRRPV